MRNYHSILDLSRIYEGCFDLYSEDQSRENSKTLSNNIGMSKIKCITNSRKQRRSDDISYRKWNYCNREESREHDGGFNSVMCIPIKTI